MMRFSAEDLLSVLLEAAPRPTVQAPRDARGLYGLVDHHGDLCYIGSTSSTDQTFYERIHQRHRTGSEGMSHYFSQMYNTGRMWRDRKDALTKADASAAQREIAVDWGGDTVVMTDLDGAKRFFRKRGWIREFFERHGVCAGDMVMVEEVASYSYRVTLQRRSS